VPKKLCATYYIVKEYVLYFLGTGLEQFQVDATSGVVRLAHRLLDNHLAIYGLLVRVSDFGTPALSSTATISIKVTSGALVDHIPTFTDKTLSIELAENVPLGTYVTTVRAVAMSMVTYELVTSKDATAFVISPSTGVIVTQVELDYETRQVYNVTVRASVSSSKYADLALTVHIVDVNDNQPVLSGKLYVGHIREDSPSGTVVLTSSGQPLTIRATDADTSENGKLSFTMIGSDAMKALNVDAATGTVRLINTIDREETSSYEFYVSVSDGGVFPLHSADVAKVVVLVDDVNDCSPTFNAPSYTADLILPTVQGVIILTASAVDNDKDASLMYTLLSNGSSTFGISSHTGDIYVDRVPAVWAARYDLLVQVSDGVHQAIQAVTVKTVQPSQSDGLKFTQAAYEMTVGEDNVEVKVLGVVQTVGREVNEQVCKPLFNNCVVCTFVHTYIYSHILVYCV
jgi:protocadherin Fat 1/2/3